MILSINICIRFVIPLQLEIYPNMYSGNRTLSYCNFENISQRFNFMALEASHFELHGMYNTLQYENLQLRRDNVALANEVFRLREMIAHYELKVINLSKNQEILNKQIATLRNNTENIMERLQKSDEHTSQQISESIKKLKKEMVYKRLESLEKKYDSKNKQYEELLTFKDKIQRLRSSWDLKLKEKDKNLENLFIWIYNQAVKARGATPLRGKSGAKGGSIESTMRKQKKQSEMGDTNMSLKS